MDISIEDLIVRSFFTNETYMRKVVPFMQPEYFQDDNKKLFHNFVKYVAKYNGQPSLEAYKVSCAEEGTFSSEEINRLEQLFSPVDAELSWLLDKTEEWCKDRAIYNAVMESISIIDGTNAKMTTGALPEIFTKALSVSFDSNVGHDYLENAKERYEFYHEKEERIPFDLELFNDISKGGLPNKSLNIVLAGTGVGKSLFMCHCAANVLIQGKNVLYITMEMAEERIAERIDANLLDLPIDQIENLSKDMFVNKVEDLTRKTSGKLIIKEYPTSQAHSGHFRALLNELKLKKKFVPDMVFIDYLNICASSRVKIGSAVNSYTYIKNIAEELRGLAVEFNIPIMSATQTTRAGFGSSDPGLEDTSESFGLPATADMMFALVSNDNLEEMSQILVKQLKNRYNDPSRNKRFVIGVDRSKMKLYDVEQNQQEDIVDDSGDDTPVFDNTDSGQKMKSFEGFKL